MTSFKVRTSEYNTSNLQDLGASLSQFIINPVNQSLVINLTPSQLNNIATTPILLIPSPGTGYYNVVNSYISTLNFLTGATQYGFSGELGIFYGNTNAVGAGINFDHTSITSNVSSISNQIGSGISDISINSVLNMGIYLVGNSFTSGTSNVKITIYYDTNTFP